MRRRYRPLIPAIAALLVFGAVVPAAARTTSAPPGATRAPDRSVTLLTGDRVVLLGGDARRAAVMPGPGRRAVHFAVHRVAGRLSVVPSDVAPLLLAGRLDRRLFDVTGLIDAGYDDAKTTSIPLIVTSDGTRARTGLRSAGATVVHDLSAVTPAEE